MSLMASPSTSALISPRPLEFGAHRSFTSPGRLSGTRASSPLIRNPEADVEILFASPNCKIVRFTPALPLGRLRTVSLDAASRDSRADGELPYGSNTEQTIALGPLLVSRLPNSIPFLSSAKFTHALLPKSACWCVDGSTKFVLKIAGGQYYRIELPCENEGDQAQADDFKKLLAKISNYEKTACPFKRGFHVELPEANTLVTKRPWRPKRAPGVTSPWSPEGQKLGNGVRIERRFPSPTRGTAQTPRRPYQPMTEDVEGSDLESASKGIQVHIVDPNPSPVEQRVPRLVATYDEFGPGLEQDPAPALSNIPQDTPSNDSRSLYYAREQDSSTDTEIPSQSQHLMNVFGHMPIGGSQPEASVIQEKDGPRLEADDKEVEETSELSFFSASLLGRSTPPPLQMSMNTETSNWLEFEDNQETPTAARPIPGIRSVTAPIYSSSELRIGFNDEIETALRLRHDSVADSLASLESSSSFHSFHSPTSPVMYSPLAEMDLSSPPAIECSPSPEMPKAHKRETSSNTITIDTIKSHPSELSTPKWTTYSVHNGEQDVDYDIETSTESDTKSFITADSPSSPRSLSLSERQPRSKSPSASLRIRLRRRRAHSPMPPPANIYIPPASLSGHLTNTILHKTASLLLGPSVQLVALMLNLARRFAEGKLMDKSYTYGDNGQAIPCEWCDSDLDVDGNSSEEEDDYGISIGGTPEKRIHKETVHQRRKTGSKGEDRWALD